MPGDTMPFTGFAASVNPFGSVAPTCAHSTLRPGAGMVDPDVFAQCKVDSEKYTGFAFGMGLERMAMLRHGVNDIKFYYEGDIRFLEQF